MQIAFDVFDGVRVAFPQNRDLWIKHFDLYAKVKHTPRGHVFRHCPFHRALPIWWSSLLVALFGFLVDPWFFNVGVVVLFPLGVPAFALFAASVGSIAYPGFLYKKKSTFVGVGGMFLPNVFVLVFF